MPLMKRAKPDCIAEYEARMAAKAYRDDLAADLFIAIIGSPEYMGKNGEQCATLAYDLADEFIKTKDKQTV